MKKIKIIALLGIICLFTGCDSEEQKTTQKVLSNGQEVNTNEMQHKHCTRKATAGNGIDVSLNYDIYYTKEDIDILKSEEKVMSASTESLDTYEEAYKKIHENYKNLEYYDTSVERGDTTVTSTITINYDKINIQQLLDIEGEEDNIIVNNKAKLEKWLELAKKFGTTCEDDTKA